MLDLDWRQLPSLTSLRAFEAAARHGSFSAAARDLNVTHAAVAQQVRALEAHVGARLVRREGRGIALTEAGRQLAVPTREAFALMAQSISQLRQSEAKRGIRATTTTYIVEAVILPRLPEFWRAHPDIQISFAPGPCSLPVDFEGFDFGIRVGSPQDWPDYHCEPILESDTVFVAAPSLVAGGAAPQDLPWIVRSSDTHGLEVLAKAGLDVERLDRRDIGSEALEVKAAKQGLGAIFGTEAVVQRELDEGTLVRLDITFPEKSVYQVITPKGPLPPSVRSFIDWLKADLART